MKSDLETYIEMILKTGKEFHVGATYQTEDFAAICIDESGGVVSLDHYDVTLLLPPLSLHTDSCITIYLYMERMVVKRVHGNPTYASPVIRVGCISHDGHLSFQENLVLSFPLFKYADNQTIVPFYQEDDSMLWTELSAKEHAFIKDNSRCTISIDRTGIYTCLNFTDCDVDSSDINRVVLPILCSTFVGERYTEDVLIEVAFWPSSEIQSQRVVQEQSSRHLTCVDGSRELLLDISRVTNETLAVDVTGICEGWTVNGGKRKYIQLTNIHEELRRSNGAYTVNFRFNRNKSYNVELACKLRIYIQDGAAAGNKQKLSLFRYNCGRKRTMSDEINSVPYNRITYKRNSNNDREVLDVIDRCLAHITKIISSNLNGVWEKRFADSLNIPKSLVESAQEISLINKALYVFVGHRVFAMNDSDIVLDFITAANAVARELENEAVQRKRIRAAKALSLPHGSRMAANPIYSRSSSYSINVHPSSRSVGPSQRLQSMTSYYQPGSAGSSTNGNCGNPSLSSGSVDEDTIWKPSPTINFYDVEVQREEWL